MPDGFSILTFLGGIKTAKDTLSLILEASKSLEKAELEYKIASLTKTLTELENQARNFERAIQEKDDEIVSLKNRLNEKTNFQMDDLPKECLDVLKLFNQNSSLSTQEIAQLLNIGDQKATHFVELLKDKRLISSFLDRLFTKYQLTQKGRKFLYDNNLL